MVNYYFNRDLHELVTLIIPNIKYALTSTDKLFVINDHKIIIKHTIDYNAFVCDTFDDKTDIYSIINEYYNSILIPFKTSNTLVYTSKFVLCDKTNYTQDNINIINTCDEDKIDVVNMAKYNYVHAIDYFKYCDIFITSDRQLVTYALFSGCKKVFYLCNNDNTTIINPFGALVVTDQQLTKDKLKNALMDNIILKITNMPQYCFITEGTNSLLYEESKKITNSPTFIVKSKQTENDILNTHYDIIQKCALSQNNFIVFNTNCTFASRFEKELIKIIASLPKHFELCFLYCEAGTKHQVSNGFYKQTDINFINSIYIINNAYAKDIMLSYDEQEFRHIYSNQKSFKTSLDSLTIFNKAILINGIGDFIIADYHYNLVNYKYIYIVTNNSVATYNLIVKLNYKYDYIKQYDTDKTFKLFNFYTFEKLLVHEKVPNNLKKELKYCDNYSAFMVLPSLIKTSEHDIKLNNMCEKAYSTLQYNVLADISKFNLPSSYIVIAPTSTNKNWTCHKCKIVHDYCPITKNIRDFTDKDWENTTKILRRRNMLGVVISTVPVGKYINGNKNYIDLVDKTTLCEAYEIVKHSSGYIGIDSCYACLSSKLFKFNIIKSTHIELDWMPHYYHNRLNNPIKIHYNIPG